MAKLKPWFHVVTSREDRPLDASEFAVHLDHIRFPCNTQLLREIAACNFSAMS
jgi:hypothetical protein